MNHTKTQKLLRTTKIWRPHIYYYCCSGANNFFFKGFSRAKNTARGVRFLLRFNIYLFLAQCKQVYLLLAIAL